MYRENAPVLSLIRCDRCRTGWPRTQVACLIRTRGFGSRDPMGTGRSPGRGPPSSPPRQARRRVLPPLRSHPPGRRSLRVLHLPHRRTAGDRTHGRYRSRDLCLAYLNALAADRTRTPTHDVPLLTPPLTPARKRPRCSTIPTTCRLAPPCGPVAASAECSFGAERTTVQVVIGAVWLHDGSTGTWTRVSAAMRRRRSAPVAYRLRWSSWMPTNPWNQGPWNSTGVCASSSDRKGREVDNHDA